MNTVKILWGRAALFWVLWALLMFGCAALISGCDPAFAYEDAHSLPIPVLTIMAEAGGEPDRVLAMQAVANTIRNRAVKRNKTIDEVCLQRLQYSCWNDRGATVYRYAQNYRHIWDDALTAWQLSGVEDVTNGADHYYATYIKEPKWVKFMRETVIIGKHRFLAS